MSGAGMSRRTVSLVAIMVGLTAATAVAFWGSMQGWYGAGSETAGLWIADIGSPLVIAMAAAIILRVALGFGKGEPFRKYWLLIGIGVACYALGDIVWAIYELRGIEPPYPGAPDVFYFAEYAFLAMGLIIASSGYRRLVDWKMPAAVTAVAAAVSAGVLWSMLLGQIASDTEVSAAEKAASLAYPLCDVFLALAPALFLLLVVSKLGGGRLARPWWAVGGGLLLLAASDTAYAWMTWVETYSSGSVIDYGWMLASVAIALGALMARDLVQD